MNRGELAGLRRWLVVRMTTATMLVVAVLVVAAPSALAVPQCTFDSPSRTLFVTAESTSSSMTISAEGGYLAVGDRWCVLLTDLNTVIVDASASPNLELTFQLENPLGPGYAEEGNGSNEVEFTVDGLGAQSSLYIIGTNANDKITLGWLNNRVTGYTAGQINVNGFADGATPDNDISFPSLPGLIYVDARAGDDVISGAGTGTFSTGQIYVPLYLAGALGSNQVTGGGGDDSIVFAEPDAPDGPDTLGGGAGYDKILAAIYGTNASLAWAAISLDGVANDGWHCPGVDCAGDFVSSDFEEVNGSGASERIVGNSDAQVLSGGGGNDLVQGFGGEDTLICAAGTYKGGPGPDHFMPRPPEVSTTCGTLSGGPGVDTVDFRTWSSAVSFSLDDVANDGGNGTTNLGSDIENLVGTAFKDTLSGSSRANVLDGLGGLDTLLGRDGDDTLLGRRGADKLNGGLGTDTCKQGPGLGTSIGCEAA